MDKLVWMRARGLDTEVWRSRSAVNRMIYRVKKSLRSRAHWEELCVVRSSGEGLGSIGTGMLSSNATRTLMGVFVFDRKGGNGHLDDCNHQPVSAFVSKAAMIYVCFPAVYQGRSRCAFNSPQ